MQSYELLCPLIQRCRLDAGLSREQVCARAIDRGLDLEPVQLAQIENEQLRVPYHIVDTLLNVLGITLGQIEREFRRIEATGWKRE